MAQYPVLTTHPREIRGKAVEKLRRQGITPIVVYGSDSEPLVLQTETRQLVRTLAEAGGTQLIAIDVEGEDEPRMALAREVQRHVTKLTPIHADFLEVDVTQVISSDVPIIVDGEAPLARLNQAILQLPMNSLIVEALPTKLPPAIVIDASQFLEIDETLYVRDLDLGDDVRIVNEPDELVARLAPAKMAVIEEEAEEGEEELEELEEGEEPEVPEVVGADEEASEE
jgi:large subunit ribosomal protein L25